MRYETFNYSDDFQDALIKCLIVYPNEFGEVGEVLEPGFFNGVEAVDLLHAIQDYKEEFGKLPTFTTLSNFVFHHNEGYNQKQGERMLEYVKKIAQTDITDWEYIRKASFKFAKERAIFHAISEIGNDRSGPHPKLDPVALMEKAMAVGDELINPVKRYTFSDLVDKPIDPSKTILGNRFLCEEGGCMFVGPSGVGKSSSSMQQNVSWACGRSAFGIKPNGPLKILLFQAENDEGDLQEMAKGVMLGLGLTEKERALVDKNLRIIPHKCKNGAEFIAMVRQELKQFEADLVRLDPLSAYLGGDPSDPKVVTPFLRNMLNPLLERHACACIIDCHTPKTNNRDTSKWKPSDFVYAMAGSNELANWPRAIIVLDATEDQGIYRFRAAKRGRRLDWEDWSGQPTTERFFKWAGRKETVTTKTKEGTKEVVEDRMWWEEATEADVMRVQIKAQEKSQPGRKPKYDITKFVPLIGDGGCTLEAWRSSILETYDVLVPERTMRDQAKKAEEAGHVRLSKNGSATMVFTSSGTVTA